MRCIAFALSLVAGLASASAAYAHASLIRSEPADRAVVAQSPSRVALTFNEPVSPLVFRLLRPNGDATELKEVAADNASVTIALPEGLGPGTHLVSWRVVSADGHPVGGALTFSIGAPSAQPPMSQSHSGRALQWTICGARLALYIGLFVGIGGTFYIAWIAVETPVPAAANVIASALACGLAAAFISIGLQGVDALGLPLSDLDQPRVWASGLATSYGLTAAIAATALILGLVILRSSPPRRRWPSSLALIGVGAALASSGHASVANPQILTRPAVFLHGVAVAFWIGALVPLSVAMGSRERRTTELRLFSRTIPIPLAVLVASGAVLAVVQLTRLDALWTTDYGLALSGKLAAVLVLLSLAAVNRYALTSRVAAGDDVAARRLAHSTAAEVLIALIVLSLVASWRFTPPPRSLFAAPEAPVHLHIHTNKAMADMEIEPPRNGIREIVTTVLDGQFAPLPAKEVTLLFAKPDVGIEALRLPATLVEGSTWRVDGVAILAPGRWHAIVEILVNDFEKLVIEDDIDIAH